MTSRISPIPTAEGSRLSVTGIAGKAFFSSSEVPFTFGTGVNDNETIPCYAGEYAPRYMPYNYAFSGYGPHMMLARLQGGSIEKEVEEPDGIAVYIFINAHIRRVVGCMRISASLGKTMPSYVIDADNRLVRKGDFMTGHPVLFQVYKVLSKSNILRFFYIDCPPRPTEKHLRLICRVIEESRNLYRETFGNDDFYVIFYPQTRYAERMIPYLEKAGVRYLDYSNLFDQTDPKYVLSKYDNHPTPLAHKTIAGKLVRDIEKLQ